jgi:methylmalonyl-CoA mutase N-terminal domain/subunit
VAAGLAVDSFAPRLSFFFNAHSTFFEEIAKFRAARRLWARIMKERFAAKDPKSMMLRFHAQTAGSTLTAQQPDVNVIRVTLQALAAVLGGAQSLHTNSRDEALGLPTAEAARLALRTQQVIAHESGVTAEPDPLGGSEYVEKLTYEIEHAAEEYIERIDRIGGTLRAIEDGYIQREIQNAAYEYQQKVEKGEAVVVGVNKFQEQEATSPIVFKTDPAIEQKQIERVRELRASRDSRIFDKRMLELEAAARCTDNLMPRIIVACEAKATVGEISDRLRTVFGEYKER